MATIFSDDFNRSNEELDASADWTERSGDWDLVSNEVKLTTESGNTWQDVAWNNSGTYSSADYDVEADVKNDSGNPQPGVVGRRVDYSTADSDYYGLVHKASATPGEVNLHKRVSGSQTELVSDNSPTVNTATFYNLRLSMNGTTLEGYLDDVLEPSTTDSALSAAGDAGLMNSNNDGYQHWDNFLAADAAGGGAANPWHAYAQQ